jgi:hypothetical protein
MQFHALRHLRYEGAVSVTHLDQGFGSQHRECAPDRLARQAELVLEILLRRHPLAGR